MIRILLVDDDWKNSMLLKKFLEAEGYEVIYAGNGCIGWELFRSSRPDLVLLDINMPEMNGFELAARIRQTDGQTLLFFLTDRTERDDRLKGFSLKGNDYIPKPFYPEELIARIKERFSHRDSAVRHRFQIGNTLFDSNLSRLTYKGATRSLTVRQTEILLLLARRPGTTVGRSLILKKVWGDDSPENSLSLNVQITYLRHLLRPDPSISILSLKKKGYILQIARSDTEGPCELT